MDLGRFDLSESLQLFGLALVIRFSRGCGSAGWVIGLHAREGLAPPVRELRLAIGVESRLRIKTHRRSALTEAWCRMVQNGVN